MLSYEPVATENEKRAPGQPGKRAKNRVPDSFPQKVSSSNENP